MSCIFCKIIASEIPSMKVYEDEFCLAFLDIQPVNLGHALVVPKQHFENLLQTPDEVTAHLLHCLKKIASGILRATNAPGFNLVVNTDPVAGQVILHTHFHIIPRFEGDGLHHWSKREIAQEEMVVIAEKIQKQLG